MRSPEFSEVRALGARDHDIVCNVDKISVILMATFLTACPASSTAG
jgi:hypothetical protein